MNRNITEYYIVSHSITQYHILSHHQPLCLPLPLLRPPEVCRQAAASLRGGISQGGLRGHMDLDMDISERSKKVISWGFNGF